MADLNRATALATKAHEGQLDKAGEPYILHPLRMMATLEGEEERIVAVLHDVVEDTDLSLEDLRAEGFSEAVLAGVDALTRRSGESYEDFIDRAARDPVGRRVKLADLFDNSDLGRIAVPTEADHARIEKYQRAVRKILGGYFTDDLLQGILAERIFACDSCGEEAGRITLVQASGGVLLQRESFTSMMGGGGYLAPDELDPLVAAVRDRDVERLFEFDLELTPFYCPECATVYCRAHWSWWTEFDDDAPSFSDCIRGRCPEGHTRMLED